MRDPKNLPLIYLISGVIAVAAALYFMTLEASNIFDWFILGMGLVAIFQGGKEYWKQKGGGKPGATNAPGTPADPGTPAAGGPDRDVADTPPDEKA